MKTIEQKAKAYDEAIIAFKPIYDLAKENNRTIDVKEFERIFPELKENEDEDERISKDIIWCLKHSGIEEDKPINPHVTTIIKDAIAWLEKQKDINSKEYVFRPSAGCDINTAAIQAIKQQKLGNKVVLAFNGAYIPVEEKIADDIVNEYYSWLEKQTEQNHKSALEAAKEENVDNRNYIKPIDNIEQKFKVGDWVVISTTEGDEVVRIASVEYFKNYYPQYFTTDGRCFGNRTKAHLFTDKND